MIQARYEEIQRLQKQADYYMGLHFAEWKTCGECSDHALYLKQRSEGYQQQINTLLEECERERRRAFTGKLRAGLKRAAECRAQGVASYVSSSGRLSGYFTDSYYSMSVYRRIARNHRAWKSLYTRGLS